VLQSVVTEQPSCVPMYRLVPEIPGGETTQSCSGIPQVSTSMKQTEERTPQGSKTELENGGSIYHTARVKREDLGHAKEPLTEAELRTKERKTLQFMSEDLEDEHVSDEPQRRQTRKTKASAKVNKVQHSLRRSGGASK